MNTDSDITILSDIQHTLEQNPDASQREIARKSRLSLGMTNAVLRRFAGKGWIMMKKLTPHTIRYVLTPEGMNKLFQRSLRYMQRTFADIRDCYDTVEKCISQAKQNGYTSVILYGESDISFLIDYACKKEGLLFNTIHTCPSGKPENNSFGIIGEYTDCMMLAKGLQEQGWIMVYEIVGNNRNK